MKALLLLTLLVTPSAFASSVRFFGPAETGVVSQLSKPKLVEMQVELLELQKFSLAGPVFTTVVGGLTAVTGASMFIAGMFVPGGLVIVGFVFLMAALVPVGIAVAWWVGALTHNEAIDAQIRALRQPVSLAVPQGVRLAAF